MLSKEMYTLLSCFPRKLGNSISYETLISKCPLEENDVIECLNETLFDAWNYVRSSNGWKKESLLVLTESGLSKIEEYEDSRKNQKITKRTLIISVSAMIISFVGVVIAAISVFK